jgi:DNA-binding response OmpR family regulator
MPDPQPPTRLLVGDDETQICRLVRDVLRPSGYEIDICQDGDEILRRYRTGGYSLLILDTMLVEMSGLEVVMKLRDRGDGIPIILMYGPRKEQDRVDTFAFTYRIDVLRKPFGVSELRGAVDRALGTGRPD